MDIWITHEARDNLCRAMGCDYETVLQRLRIDTPLWVGGRYVGPALPPGQDIWGLLRKSIDHGTGAYDEVVNSPLADFETPEDVEANYQWPSVDHWDFSHLPAEVRGQEHRPIRGGGSEPLLLYKLLRGEEQALMDLVINPEMVEYCLGKLFDFAYEQTRRIFESIPGKVMITYVAEDLGGQDALMYSPAHIRRFLFPGMKRMVELTRQNGSVVFHHSDGSIRQILPDLVELGIQVLNPIQWRCRGMEREALKRDFGDSLIFHGGVDNQQTLPFGTPEDVRAEVEENIRTLGAGGGYILAPCHNIQDNTPAENIIALYQAGLEFGGGR
jgi:uroporphyrinogen decarboxylase